MINREGQQAELIAKLRKEYISKTEKVWWTITSETYTETTAFIIHEINYKDEKNQVFFKNNKSGYIIFIAIFITMIGFGFYPYLTAQKITEQSGINFFYGGLGLLITAIKFLTRKKIILVDRSGIYYYKWDDYIKWDNVAIIFLKTTTSSDEDVANKNEIIIHFYSENYHIFMSEIFGISKLDGKVSQIINAIECFRKLAITKGYK